MTQRLTSQELKDEVEAIEGCKFVYASWMKDRNAPKTALFYIEAMDSALKEVERKIALSTLGHRHANGDLKL